MIKHRHTYSCCCRPEVADGIILSCGVKAVEGCVMVNFEVASCSIFPDNREKKLPDAEVGTGAGGINAICSRHEVADDIIDGCSVETFRGYHAANL